MAQPRGFEVKMHTFAPQNVGHERVAFLRGRHQYGTTDHPRPPRILLPLPVVVADCLCHCVANCDCRLPIACCHHQSLPFDCPLPLRICHVSHTYRRLSPLPAIAHCLSPLPIPHCPLPISPLPITIACGCYNPERNPMRG